MPLFRAGAGGCGSGDRQGGDGMMARMRLLEAEGVITQGREQVMGFANDLACLREGRPSMRSLTSL